MARNEAQLTFTGDTSGLTKAFDQVGAGARGAETKVKETGAAFDSVGQKIGDQERRWQGLRSSITGGTDTLKGSAAIMKGDWLGGSVLVAGGLADLAQGFADTLVPLAKNIAGFAASKAAMVAHVAWSGLVKIATLAQTAANWLLASSTWAALGPILIIIVAIAALVAVVVLIATKTKWFQTIWRVAWGGIKDAAVGVWNWLKDLPGKLGGVFSGLASAITAPFRAAFNFIADAWNNTIGALSFSIPNWVPIIGGNSFDVPNMPHFHQGGVVPGSPGTSVVAMLQAGETVIPAGRSRGAAKVEVHFTGDTNSAFASAFAYLVRTQRINLAAMI